MTTISYDTSEEAVLANYSIEIEQRIARGELKLPVLPQVIREVLAMKNDPEFSMAELSARIHQDHTLAGHVLRISNSSAYAGAYKTETLTQAIARLGGHALARIAVSITMKGEVFNVVDYKEEVKEIWSHALASGVYSQEMAEMCGHKDEGMYMCGLMHQVGKPVLLQTIVELAKGKLPALSHEGVERILARYHCEVGSKIAATWKLPHAVKASCLFYRVPHEADQATRAVLITHLASRMANLVMEPGDDWKTEFCDDSTIKTLGITEAHVDKLFAMRGQVIDLMKAMSL